MYKSDHGLIYSPSDQHACVSEILKGIKRTVGTAQPGKEPLFTADLRKMMEALPANLLGARDRALLVMGFAGGFRRSELAALDIADVAETDDGLVLSLRRSKTDQEGQGAKVALPWVPNQPGACWISTANSYVGFPANVPVYFSTTFDLTGLDPATVSITIRWAADYAGSAGIYLNGVSIPGPHVRRLDLDAAEE